MSRHNRKFRRTIRGGLVTSLWRLPHVKSTPGAPLVQASRTGEAQTPPASKPSSLDEKKGIEARIVSGDDGALLPTKSNERRRSWLRLVGWLAAMAICVGGWYASRWLPEPEVVRLITGSLFVATLWRLIVFLSEEISGGGA